jgi:hypothetical protein
LESCWSSCVRSDVTPSAGQINISVEFYRIAARQSKSGNNKQPTGDVMRRSGVFAAVMLLAIASIFVLARSDGQNANSGISQKASIDALAIHLTVKVADLPVLVIRDIN